MSKPFTLTIVNGNSGRLKPAEFIEVPKADNTSTFADRLRARCVDFNIRKRIGQRDFPR